MSEQESSDWLSRPVWVVNYSFVCDAVGCVNRCELTVDEDTDELIRVDGVFVDSGCPIADMAEARRYLTVVKGWQEGTRGVQYGHLYCPRHREES